MKIAEIHSHLNGLEWLIVQKPALWKEIQSIIASLKIDQFKCPSSSKMKKRYKKPYDGDKICAAFEKGFHAKSYRKSEFDYWLARNEKIARRTMELLPDDQKDSIFEAREAQAPSFNQTDFVKDRVAIEVQFGKYAFVAYDLFVKHLAFYIGDHIDVGVEILAMKSLQSQMSSGVAYYEGEFYNVVRQGRGVPAVPLVLIGVEP